MAEINKQQNQRITITLMLTHQCNLNCVYCYEKNKDTQRVMTIDTMKSIVTSSFAKYKDSFKEIVFDFMGGEPMLEFETIRQLAEWTWEQQWPMPYLFYATTNGTLLTDEMKDWLRQYKERFVLGLSYDGNPLVQDQNRSYSSNRIDIGFFTRTWPFQSIKMTISPFSISYLYDSIKYLNQIGVKKIFANLAYGVEWRTEHLNIYQRQLSQLVSYYNEHPEIERVSLLNINLLAIFHKNSGNKYCGAGSGMVFHDFDGHAFPCHLLSPVNLDLDALNDIKDTDYCDGDAFAPDECKSCKLFNICPSCCGMNYLYMKSFKSRFPFMCQAIKIQTAQNMMLQYNLLKCKNAYTENDKLILGAINNLKQYQSITKWTT